MNNILSERAKQARAEYMKQWRKNNKARVQVYNASYWERVAREQEGGRQRGQA